MGDRIYIEKQNILYHLHDITRSGKDVVGKKHRSEGGAPSDEGSSFLQYSAGVLQ